MKPSTLPEAKQIEILSSMIPMLRDHLENMGAKMTSTGMTLTPEWIGWTLKAFYVTDESGESTMSFTAEQALEFLSE